MKQLWYEPESRNEVVPGKINRVEAEANCLKDEIKLRSWYRIHLPSGYWL